MTKFGRAKSFLVAIECFYVTTKLAMVERLYVTTECGQLERFCVATGNFMLRHSWPGWEEIMSRLSIFMSRQSWQRQGEIMLRQSILCRTELAKVGRISVATKLATTEELCRSL